MSVYAVFEASGKQHRVMQGQVIKLDKIEKELGAAIEFNKILLIKNDNGDIKIGNPAVPGCKIVAEIVSHGRDKKINVIKFKRRKKYLRKQGHRQWFTEIKIKEIVAA